MDNKLKKGQEIKVNILFTYTIGGMGCHSGVQLNTIDDCKVEALAEIEAGINESDVYLVTEK